MKDLSKLTVNVQPHIDNGFTILTNEDIQGRRSGTYAVKWAEDIIIEAKGVTLSEAMEAMKKCN